MIPRGQDGAAGLTTPGGEGGRARAPAGGALSTRYDRARARRRASAPTVGRGRPEPARTGCESRAPHRVERRAPAPPVRMGRLKPAEPGCGGPRRRAARKARTPSQPSRATGSCRRAQRARRRARAPTVGHGEGSKPAKPGDGAVSPRSAPGDARGRRRWAWGGAQAGQDGLRGRAAAHRAERRAPAPPVRMGRPKPAQPGCGGPCRRARRLDRRREPEAARGSPAPDSISGGAPQRFRVRRTGPGVPWSWSSRRRRRRGGCGYGGGLPGGRHGSADVAGRQTPTRCEPCQSGPRRRPIATAAPPPASWRRPNSTRGLQPSGRARRRRNGAAAPRRGARSGRGKGWSG